MVATTGYGVTELLAIIVLSYVLLVGFIITVAIRSVLRDVIDGKERIWKVVVVGIVGLVLLTLLYQLPVRIGTIMFIDGMLLSGIVVQSFGSLVAYRGVRVEKPVEEGKSGGIVGWVFH